MAALIQRHPTDDFAASLLERRWFAAGRAALETQAECAALAQVLEMARTAWRVTRVRLSELEALRDALGEELAAADVSEFIPEPKILSKSPVSRSAA